MRLKIILILSFLLYQTGTYSKTTEINEFNQQYLSNYFSALLSYDNQNNDDAIKFFNESKKFLIKKHDKFLKRYVFSLVLDGQIKKAIYQIKILENSKNSNFFEAKLLLALDNITKKKFKNAEKILNKLGNFENNDNYEFVIYKIVEDYNKLFLTKKIQKNKENFGKLSLITNTFQNCYLNSKKKNSNFINLINSEEGDYSRYLFFHLANIIKNKEYNMANEISKTIEPLSSSLLISQSKKWIEEKQFKKFVNYFSCKNENHLLAEFFFFDIEFIFITRKF